MQSQDAKMTCPDCDGAGVLVAIACPGFRRISMPCLMCKGEKVVSVRVIEWKRVGEEMKQERIARGVTLRIEAQQRGMDAVELSEMERGIREPIRRATEGGSK